MKKSNPIPVRRAALAIAAALLLAGCGARPSPVPQEEPESGASSGREAESLPELPVDLSFETITAGIELPLWDNVLAITRPAEDLEVSEASYYITGISDPEQDLFLNGEPVEDRGMLGSFGVFVELEEGENRFDFVSGEETASVTVTRSEEEDYSTTDRATRMRPEIDAAARAGAPYLLACTAPSGAEVSASVEGRTVPLEQAAATEAGGVPARFTGEFIPEDVSGTVELGSVVYTVVHQGEAAEYRSEGRLYVVGQGDDLLVRGKTVAATVFEDESLESGFFTTLPQGAVDVVTEIGGSMYRLGVGGWILKDAVEILTGAGDCQNAVSAAGLTVSERWETLALEGTSQPPYTAGLEDGVLSITLYHTAGIGSLEEEARRSALFSAIDVAEENGNVTLTFRPAKGIKLWGYLVEYDENRTGITVKRRPEPAEGNRPLTGVTVALDPGHGGGDNGAYGIARENGPTEKEINLATARVTKRYLESLGATVRMTREDDSRVEMDDRMALLRDKAVDIGISLHCNSIEASRDGTGPSGVETYYFDRTARFLAEEIQRATVDRTGRKDRESKNDYYKITLNSYAPSVMVEMGFLTNPAEYDQLCARRGFFTIAEAIAEGIVSALERADAPDWNGTDAHLGGEDIQ